jgi:hypothetical protein
LAISLEELGKAVAFRLCADGFGKIEGNARRRKVVLTLPVVGRKEFALFDHPTKRGIPFWLEFLLVMVPGTIRIFGVLGRAGASPDSSPPTPGGAEVGVPPQSAKRKIGEAGAEATPTSFEADRERAEAEGELFRDLEALKQAGLYVDFDGFTVSVPTQITREKYELAARVIDGYIGVVERALERGIVAGLVADSVNAFFEVVGAPPAKGTRSSSARG